MMLILWGLATHYGLMNNNGKILGGGGGWSSFSIFPNGHVEDLPSISINIPLPLEYATL